MKAAVGWPGEGPLLRQYSQMLAAASMRTVSIFKKLNLAREARIITLQYVLLSRGGGGSLATVNGSNPSNE